MIPELANTSFQKVVVGFLSLVAVTVLMLVVLKAAGTERLQSMVDEMRHVLCEQYGICDYQPLEGMEGCHS